MKKNVLVITVNYGSPSSTIKLIESIPSNDNINIWVEDNQSSDESFEELNLAQKTLDKDFEIYDHTKNHYYWGAFNKALKRISDFNNNTLSWIIICNNDIVFSQNFFKELYKINNSENYILAPTIISNKKKTDLNPFLVNPLSAIDKFYYKLLYINPLLGRLIQIFGSRINRFRKKLKAKPQPNDLIYAPHGACMIFSSEFFKMGGYVDDGFKMFGEEISTAEIAKKIGISIHYHPQLIVNHYDHQSTKRLSWKQLYDLSKETFNYFSYS